MTVSYNDSFLRLLLYWKGSLYKAIWKELLIYTLLYYSIYCVYNYGFDTNQQIYFGLIRDKFESATNLVPLKFILGFFVTSVMARWWAQLQLLHWPDSLILHICGLFEPDHYRLIKRTAARWINLTCALSWREISSRILKRFPSPKHLVEAGLMTKKELYLFEKTHSEHGKWFLPIIWLTSLLERCHRVGVINSPQLVRVMAQVMDFHQSPAKLYFYQWICIPLLYTQVATIAAYGYFAICLIGRQVLNSDPLPYPIPIFTCLQFMFFIGWLKVGQTLINPLGEDEDDFELSYLLDRNVHVALQLADGKGRLRKNIFDLTPNTMLSVTRAVPYTKAAAKTVDMVPKGHTRKVILQIDELQVIHVDEKDLYTHV